MVSSDEGQRVFHLRNGAWHPIAWEDWIKFCSQDNRWAPLPYVTAGEHYFVVCILEDGRLLNILPHRYLVDRDGRIANDRYFGVLSISEIEQFEELNRRHYEYPQTHPLTKSEQQMFDAFRERLWRSWLPPAEAVRHLTMAATALPDETDSAWQLLEASGFTRATSRSF